MKNKFMKFFISIILVVSMLFSVALTTACTGFNSGSSSGGEVEVPPLPSDTPEDRSAYSADSLVTAVTSSYLKDFVPDGEGLPALSLLEGYLVGDFYTSAIDYVIDYVKTQPMLANFVDMLDLVLYRGIDGNWYRICYVEKNSENVIVYENVRVNPVLNEVLNYNLDGSGTLNVNYSGYGGKTLGYILFEYNEPGGDSVGTIDRDSLISYVINQNPVVKAVLNTTVNELKTIVEGTSGERLEVLLKNFGGLTIGDLSSLSQSNSEFTDALHVAIYKVTINQLYELTQVADKSEFYAKLSEIFNGVTLGNVAGKVEGNEGYISNIHTMTLGGIFGALSKDELSEYLLKDEYIGGLSVDKLVRYLITDADALAKYETVYADANAKLLLDSKLNTVITAYKAGEEAVVNGINAIIAELKEIVVYNDVTVGAVIEAVEGCVTKDESGNITDFDFVTFAQTMYGYFAPAGDGQTVDIQAIMQSVYEQYLAPIGITKESVIGYVQDNYGDIITKINGIISENEGFDFSAEFKELTEKELSAVLEELKGKLTEESADVEAVISEFISAYAEVLVNILKTCGKYGDEITTLITYYTGVDGVVDYKAVLEGALGLYAQDLTIFAVNEACSYLEGLKLETDVVIKEFVDSEGVRLDVTVNELLTLAIEELKTVSGEGDPRGALKDMLGDAKVSTLIELISTLAQSTVVPN